MNITAKELSGMHVGKKIKLGEIWATIKSVTTNSRTVDVNAEVLDQSTRPGLHYLSIPLDSTVTIQSDETAVNIRATGTTKIVTRFATIEEYEAHLSKNSMATNPEIDFAKATRIELIRNFKRDTIKYGEPGVKIYVQDDGRTLKIHYKEEQ